jgi:dynein heavy chain
VPGAHPGPLLELDFWTERAANLNSIHDQLQGEKVQKVIRVLQVGGPCRCGILRCRRA